MATWLPPFPVDDLTLDAIEHALGASLNDNHQIVGADYSLTRLLDWYAQINPDNHTVEQGVTVLHDTHYSEHDLIRSLIAEVRRLRAEVQ